MYTRVCNGACEMVHVQWAEGHIRVCIHAHRSSKEGQVGVHEHAYKRLVVKERDVRCAVQPRVEQMGEGVADSPLAQALPPAYSFCQPYHYPYHLPIAQP